MIMLPILLSLTLLACKVKEKPISVQFFQTLREILEIGTQNHSIHLVCIVSVSTLNFSRISRSNCICLHFSICVRHQTGKALKKVLEQLANLPLDFNNRFDKTGSKVESNTRLNFHTVIYFSPLSLKGANCKLKQKTGQRTFFESSVPPTWVQ